MLLIMISSKRSIVLLFLAIVLFAMTITYTSNLLIDIAETETISNIKDVEMGVENKKIWLNIHLHKPMTCKEVMKELELINISFEEKQFSPICRVVSNKLIKISYEETVSI